jgi:hypothetical protein
MMRRIFTATILILALASAIAWAFTSHKYDCFNIGPCRGDVDFWIRLGDLAQYSFFGSWLALVCAALLLSKQMIRARSRIFSWLVAVALPPVALLGASWIFNIGVKVANV